LRSAEAERCIRAVLAGTRHTDFEWVVAVSQPGPLDAAQRAVAARIEADGRARVLPLRAERFNFSWVNNKAIADTAGEHVLLLNDDVAPIEPDWLDAMAAHLADPAVGAVGAKLLYPGGTVQHGGVIMGMGGLCDHAHRHLDGDAPGYAWRAVLAQELSAVTGACMLVRRRALERVGGLDESYPSAFNDVDLCLRVREAGYSVVFAPEAVLHHHELRTYGSHYAGERARFHEREVARMRVRWAGVIAEDPFHNPNLDLTTGREWEPAFPPRLWPTRASLSQKPARHQLSTLGSSKA
ncbi:MAG: glycosyltransferase, partial [Acetobacteraceae bacterium]|nr:glycosyltransferase [Acetobacteraceae bacterium]